MPRISKALVLLTALSALSWSASAQAGKKNILGWVEFATLVEHDFTVKAKLDTGAKTSSIHAKDIETFKKDGKTWVRFHFETKEFKNDKRTKGKKRRVTIERPRVRNVIIKRHKTDYQERPVVEIALCINGEEHIEQFSLIDRSRFIYPVLLGRRALKDMALVDPGKTFLTSSKCQDEDNRKKDR